MDDRDDTAKQEAADFNLAAMLLIVCLTVVALSGCSGESRTKQTMVITGTLNGEPVELVIDGNSTSLTKVGPDAEQVKQIVKAGLDGLKESLPGVSEIEAIVKATMGPAKPPEEPGLVEDLVKGGLGAAAAWAAAKTLEARYHAKDAAEGWSKALPPGGAA